MKTIEFVFAFTVGFLCCQDLAHGQEAPQFFTETKSAIEGNPEGLLEPSSFVRGEVLDLNLTAISNVTDAAEFELNFLGAEKQKLALSPVISPSTESRAWSGKFEGGELTLVVRTGAALKDSLLERKYVVSGIITLGSGSRFEIKQLQGTQVLVRELDQENWPEETEPIVPNLPPLDEAQEKDIESEAKTALDVAVFYTRIAREGAGGTSEIRALIDLAVLESNDAFSDSGIDARLHLVAVAETNDDESGSFQGMLTALATPRDGRMDEVHYIRDEHRADLVVLICEDDTYCGLAYRMQHESPAFEKYAFSVVSRKCAVGYYSFVHELGHNFGCCHDKNNLCRNPLQPDAYGWHFRGRNELLRTIMAYQPGKRIKRFSNASLSYEGEKTGKSGSAENFRVINSTKDTVAEFR